MKREVIESNSPDRYLPFGNELKRRVFLTGLGSLALTACAPRGALSIAPNISAENVQPVWTVTSEHAVKVAIHKGKYAKINPISPYARFEISIPKTHEQGQIEWPNSQLDPKNKFFVSSQRNMRNLDAFIDEVGYSISADQEIVVFVHGFNTTYPEAVYRHAQIAQDFDLNGPQITFVWPSEGRVLGYLADRDNVLIARDALQRFLTRLYTRFPKRVLLVGHSMGAFLAMETLRQSAPSRKSIADNLAGLVLISPDIGIEVFKSQAARVNSLPEQTIVFVSQKDRALRLSQRLAGGKARLGEGDDIRALEDLNILVVDLSNVKGGDPQNHSVAMTSPAAISFLRGLISGETVLTEQAGIGLQILEIPSAL